MKKYFGRKFLLFFVLFVFTQYMKFSGIIGDMYWAIVSLASICGYSTVNYMLKKLFIGEQNGTD